MKSGMSTFQFVTIVGTCIAIIIALLKIMILIKTTKDAHERQRSQSTIEYLGNLWEATREKINPNIPNLNELDNLSETDEYPNELKAVSQIFETLERMSIGLTRGVYDKYLFYKMVRLITLNNTLKYFEPHIRFLKKTDSVYSSEFEKLVGEYNSQYFQYRARD